MMQRGKGTDRTDSPSFRMDSPDRIPAADLDTNSTDEIITTDKNGNEGENRDDDDFEFSFIRIPDPGPPISADDIFSDGKIRPIYPVFNRDLLIEKDQKKDDGSSARSIRLPLRRLFIEEERERASFSSTSSSSSSTDELDRVPPGSYCVWNPNQKDQIKKRSSSTGSSSSLRWRLRDLVVGRSHSDGKEKFVFIPVQEEKNGGKKEINKDINNKGKKVLGKKSTASTAKTFLPYKPDIVGFFAINGVNRTTTRHPF